MSQPGILEFVVMRIEHPMKDPLELQEYKKKAKGKKQKPCFYNLK